MSKAFLFSLVTAVICFSSIADAQTRNQDKRKVQEPPPKPVVPAPLPVLPPPLSAQALPYPREFLKRPYTLPSNLRDITVQDSLVNVSSHNQSIEAPLYLLDFTFRKPLTSDFNLVLNPLPLGIQYQPKRTDTVLTGVSWIVGWQFQGNFGVFPQFTSFYRHFLSASSAIEMQLQYGTFIPFRKAPSIWRGSFRIGPIYQYSESIAFSPRAYIWIDNVRLSEAFQEDRTRIENQKLTAEGAQFQIPLSVWSGWSINQNWDLTGEYTYFGTGLSGDTYAQLLTFGLTTRF